MERFIRSPAEREKSANEDTRPSKKIIKIEGEIKNYLDKQKLKEYSNTKPNIKEILKYLL